MRSTQQVGQGSGETRFHCIGRCGSGTLRTLLMLFLVCSLVGVGASSDVAGFAGPPVVPGDLSGDTVPELEPRQTGHGTEVVDGGGTSGMAAASAVQGNNTAESITADQLVGAGRKHPFQRRVKALAFPRDAEWLNTSRAFSLEDFSGRFVLLDFWTYCCINCMHVLPELKKLERAYPEELVVVGVHSAKFETEQDRKNIEEAILRYEIEHPVINDADHTIWNAYGVRSWPTVLLIDPEGQVVFYQPGEFRFEQIQRLIADALPYYRAKGVLAEEPLEFELLADSTMTTPLRFPGKILADEASGRLFIADSNHNRIVISSLEGQVLDIIGSGEIGREDGDYATASFDHPQGMYLHGDTLYVADTENHMLRKVDLVKRQVKRIAGTGEQGTSGFPGMEKVTSVNDLPERWVGRPLRTALSSPWALWVHRNDLYIAMAGPHQIWKMPLSEREIGPYAGNGREDIVDGPLLPRVPYQTGFSSFAQPSGLASDGQVLYVADSEGSSIRSVPFDPAGEVKTVVGTAHLPVNRLFTFGDVDGPPREARLQHVLGVVHHEGQLYVADTYNNKIKTIDLASGVVTTLAGTGDPGTADAPAQFDEPAGISYAAGRLYVADTNNHTIRTIALGEEPAVATLALAGLTAPEASETKKKRKPSFPGATKVDVKPQTVRAVDGKLQLRLQLEVPDGWKINPEAPMGYLVELEDEQGVIDRAAVGTYQRVDKPTDKIELKLPVSGSGGEQVKISMNYYHCETGDTGVCKTGAVIWKFPLTIQDNAEQTVVTVKHTIDPAK